MGGLGSGGQGKPVKTFVPEPGTEPWERQPFDTDRSWRAFVAYRDMDNVRSHQRVVDSLGKKASYIHVVHGWAIKYFWRFRVTAWDSYQDKIKVEARNNAKRQAALDMVDRHLQISTHLQRLASVELLRWIHHINGDVDNPDTREAPKLKPDQIQKLLEYAIKLERLNRDEPGEITENRNGPNLDEAQLEERILHLLKLRGEG